MYRTNKRVGFGIYGIKLSPRCQYLVNKARLLKSNLGNEELLRIRNMIFVLSLAVFLLSVTSPVTADTAHSSSQVVMSAVARQNNLISAPHRVLRSVKISNVNSYLSNNTVPDSNAITAIQTNGEYAVAIAYVPTSGYIYVNDQQSSTGGPSPSITVINDRTDSILTTINYTLLGGAGSESLPSQYDPVNGFIYFANQWSLLIFNTTSNRVVKNFYLPSYETISGMAINPVTGNLYFVTPQGMVGVINATSNTIVQNRTLASSAFSIAFDSYSGLLYASASNSTAEGLIYVLNGTTLQTVKTMDESQTYSGCIVYDPSVNVVYYTQGPGTPGPLYVFDGRNGNLVGTYLKGLDPTFMTLGGTNGDIYMINNGNIVVVNVSNYTISLTYKEDVTSMAIASSLGKLYGVLSPEVNGTVVAFHISWANGVYNVSFREKSLPTAFPWDVTVDGLIEQTDYPTLHFFLPNGSYSFIASSSGFASFPLQGVAHVNGSNASIQLLFSAITYPVAFHENGLRGGIPWAVSVEGVSASQSGVRVTSMVNITSKTPYIMLNITNGTYVYNVQPIKDWSVNQTGGIINITGDNVTVQLEWTAVQPPFLYRSLWGLPVFAWLQFLEVAAVIAGTILVSEFVRKTSGKK